MIKIILTGACGRMGLWVRETAEKNPAFCIAAKVDICGGEGIYSSIAEYQGEADVIIDFSHHSALASVLEYAVSKNIPAIICTTGHTAEELALLDKASESIPVFKSGNMSLGINVMLELVRRASAALEGYDIEIIEKHHNQKLDAPSGTALMLADAAAENIDGAEYVYDRHSVRAKRRPEDIGISSVRGGTIVGEHEVIFAGTDEVITISHSAQSRNVFAQGALKAAAFMAGVNKPGKYDMSDVLKATGI